MIVLYFLSLEGATPTPSPSSSTSSYSPPLSPPFPPPGFFPFVFLFFSPLYFSFLLFSFFAFYFSFFSSPLPIPSSSLPFYDNGMNKLLFCLATLTLLISSTFPLSAINSSTTSCNPTTAWVRTIVKSTSTEGLQLTLVSHPHQLPLFCTM